MLNSTTYDPDWPTWPDLTLDTARAQVRMLLASRRYDAEQTGCITVDGIPISTAREVRASLAQAVALGLSDQRRKLVDGAYAVLTASQLRAALIAAMAAVQALYDAEAAEVAAIEDMTLETILQRYP